MRRSMCHLLAVVMVVVPMARPLLAAGDDAPETEPGEIRHGQAALAHATPEKPATPETHVTPDAEHGQAALAHATPETGEISERSAIPETRATPETRAVPNTEQAQASLTPAAPDLAETLARAQLARRLVELGSTPDHAIAAVGMLTAEDVAVLADNPNMMQRAGEMSRVGWSIVVGVIIVAGVIALVIATDGTFSLNL